MRRFLTSAALTLASIVLIIGLMEASLRLTHYGDERRTHIGNLVEYDRLLGWSHKKSFSYEQVTPEYQTVLKYNSRGVRGRQDRGYTKPPNISRVVVLGDSFVDGATSQLEDRVTEVLESSLGSGYEVINLGVVGYSTDQELLMLQTEGLKYQPDLVILAFYYNDVVANGRKIASGRTQKPVFVLDRQGDPVVTNTPVPRPAPALEDRFRVYDLVRTTLKQSPIL